ncbi:glutamate receptor 2.9-like [Tasmannia lanceolata]|uniref:glutamate receptor 2.9-like n=1 Tax=Tasmannia lanceolata TaxID=3420 RepID=UPI004063EB47
MHNTCLLSKAKMLPSRLYSLPSRALFVFLFSFLLLSHAAKVTAQVENGLLQANIGAIIDANSRIGREEKIAMEIAIEDFNNSSPTTRLALHISDSSGNPLQAVSAVEELINQNQAQVIVGMASWEEAMLVADAINREQVPIISLTTATVTPPLMTARWPFLIPMGNNNSAEMKCVAAIVDTYGWRRITVIYEDSTYGGHAGTITLLTDSLREVGSEIENQLVIPPLASLSDPETSILEELEKLNSQQCRVFVLLHSSLPLAVRLFVEANKMGMMGKGYVWITTSSITSLVDSFNSSVISNSQGVIGIKPYFSETTKEFRAFNIRFRRNFQLEYSDQEENPNPGIFALRAYDSIWAVGKAIERNSTGGEHLVESILSNNFSGLSGKISFEDGELTGMPTFQIINVIGKSYRELGFWSPEFGFSNSAIEEKGGVKLESKVFWPGGQTSTPKGWVAATDAKPLIIGVPGKTAFNQFVKVVNGSVSGFCIDVFEEAVKLLPYDLPHEFVPYDGTYNDLVKEVYYKKFDAVVGDTTILAERSEYVEFSQPYDESGLSMLVTVKEEGSRKAWLFMRPFTKPMWAVTGAIFVYTGFVVWFLEHRRNPDFRGPWRSQVGTMLWFTFSTLFFAHRERLRSNFSRVVIVVWLFVVLILTSSYTASLTSMLTVQRLEPTVNDIDSLRKSNAMVGCDGDSFVLKYLQDVLHFPSKNIIKVSTADDYPEDLRSGKIAAAFLELPYLKVFLAKYCKGFAIAGPTYRLGGFGFVFPLGSPLATDISTAILKLSENAKIRQLEKNLVSSFSKCSTSNVNTESLSLANFWGLFVITGGTSTIVLLLFLAHLVYKIHRLHVGDGGNASPMNESVWKRTVTLVKYWDNGQIQLQERTSTPSAADTEEWNSISLECESVHNDAPEHPQSPALDVENQTP